MATYSTNFSEYTTGVSLSDWTDYWSVGGFTYTAETNSGDYKVSTKWLDFNASVNNRRVLTWDDIGSVSDVDILAKVKIGSAIAASGPRIYARVGGTSGSEDSYHVDVNSTDITLYKYVAGASTSLVTIGIKVIAAQQYWIRFRVNGTDLKTRLWAEDCVEPEDWTLETTDSSLSSGYVGVGQYYGTQDFYCDFFECVTVTGSATYPPSSFIFNDAFSNLESLEAAAYLDSCRIMSGYFIDSARKLKGVGVYCTTHSDDIRIAVYSGGTASAPLGATLLKDFGKTSGAVTNDYVQIFTTDDIDIPTSAYLWVVIKGDNAAGFEFTSTVNADAGNHGNYQRARGRCDATVALGKDPDVAYAATFPAGAVSFNAYWYDIKVYLDGHPDAPKSGAVGISENGSLTLVGWASEQNGSVGISGNGSLTLVGNSNGDSAIISGNGDIALTGICSRLGSAGISANGSLVFPDIRQGTVRLSAEGDISAVFWINQPVERVWTESKMAQGIVGVSILKRDNAKWQT